MVDLYWFVPFSSVWKRKQGKKKRLEEALPDHRWGNKRKITYIGEETSGYK